MRTSLAVVIIGLALSACVRSTNALPNAFAGGWDLTPAACADPDGVTRLGVDGSKLQYYEWGGDVVSARPDGAGSVRVALDWWSIDEVDTNDRAIVRRVPGKLTLSRDRSRLEVDIEGEVTSYIRCPGAPAGPDERQD